MSVPSPNKALNGHCSTIENGQLYVLSSDSFQSIALKENATWNQEATGKAVSGAACAKVTNADASKSALYVIGGTSDDSSYMGLQRYFFGNKTWETLTPPNSVMRNRLNHSAIYIPESNDILVYAGSPSNEPSWLSSQTFTIVAQAPFVIDAYTAKGHTANLPILTQWNNSHVLMTGGSSLTTSVMLFSREDGWSTYGTSLPAPLDTGVKGELIIGTDGSKVLQTYDLTTSPNQVHSLLMQGADGQPAAAGTNLGSPGAARRDLTASNWPTYNNTLAPTITRSDYAIASNDQGLVAFTGGNSGQSIELFNQTTNGWVDTSRYFYGNQAPLITSTTSSSSSSSTPTTSSTGTATSASASATSSGSVPDAVVADANSKQHALLVLQLGVIIGVLAGLFVLFLLILLFLRYRKKKKAAQQGYGEGGRMSFADRGASFMKEAEGSQHNFFPTADRYNNSSRLPPVAPGALRSSRFSMPRFSRGSKGPGMPSHQPKGSWESTKELVDKDLAYEKGIELSPVSYNSKKPLPSIIRKPAPTYQSDRAEIAHVLGLAAPLEEEKDKRKRSSGWSRYFATSQPTGETRLSHLPSAYREGVPPTESVYSQDQDTVPAPPQAPVPAMPAHIPASGLMAPLNIDFTKTIDGQRLSTVATSNPSFANSREDLAKRGSLAEAQAGKIEQTETRPVSTITSSSYTNRRRTRSSIAASEYFANQHGINGTWTPMTTSFKDHVNEPSSGDNSRRTSSMYTNSVYGEPHTRRKSGGATFFPGAGTPNSGKGSKSKMTYSAAPSADWASVQHELKHPSEFRDSTRESNITVFPEPMGDSYTAVARGPSQKSTKAGSGLAGLTSTANTNTERASNMTLFPRAVSMKHYPGMATQTNVQPMPAAATAESDNTDTSWVNLGIGAAK